MRKRKREEKRKKIRKRKGSIVKHTCYPSTQETEQEFETSLGYTARP
jgi:hypothetical protein